MKNIFFALTLALATLVQSGCAAGFRAGGPNGGGVNAGVGIGNPNQPVYVPATSAYTPVQSSYTPSAPAPRVIDAN